jgi:uncharacterized protein (DUF1330 family)
MPKGYWIARVDVHDPVAFKNYATIIDELYAKYGARFVVRGGTHEVVEGSARQRTAVLEFPSYEAALGCYNSPEYARAKAARFGVAEADLVIIEGYDGPQPGA